jgi:hypothetical protein
MVKPNNVTTMLHLELARVRREPFTEHVKSRDEMKDASLRLS